MSSWLFLSLLINGKDLNSSARSNGIGIDNNEKDDFKKVEK